MSTGRYRYVYDGANMNKVVGCLYSEVSGTEVKYSYVFSHPREDVITTVVPHPKFPGATRRVFTVNTSRARLRNKAKELFDGGDTHTVSVNERTGHGITSSILQDVRNHLPYTTRAAQSVDMELAILELSQGNYSF